MERFADAALRRGYALKRQAHGALRLTEFIPAAN